MYQRKTCWNSLTDTFDILTTFRFLHMYDLSKMPLCRHGERCKVQDCPFRHISEANRLECVFYSQGFCIHGPFCRYKHLRKDRVELPAVADFTLGLSQMQAATKDGVVTKRPAPKPNEFYKISLCKHFLQGECPFGDGCHFAHGEEGTFLISFLQDFHHLVAIVLYRI